MAVTYRARAGDRLDTVCLQHYGRVDVIERVLAANSGLSEQIANGGGLLQVGVEFQLPDIPVAEKKRVSLWD